MRDFGIIASKRKQAEEDAAISYADHVLTKEGEGRWLFTSPVTGMFSMRVIEAPGAVITYGDGEDLIFCPHDSDALGWLMSVLRAGPGRYDVYYLCEKIPQNFVIAKFSTDLVDDEVAELRKEAEEEDLTEEYREKLTDAADSLDGLEGGIEAAYEILSGVRDELPQLKALEYGVMHQLAGLYYFSKALVRSGL